MWVTQLGVSGPRALAKQVVSGGRTGYVTLTKGLEVNRLDKVLPSGFHSFSGLREEDWGVRREQGVERKA